MSGCYLWYININGGGVLRGDQVNILSIINF